MSYVLFHKMKRRSTESQEPIHHKQWCRNYGINGCRGRHYLPALLIATNLSYFAGLFCRHRKEVVISRRQNTRYAYNQLAYEMQEHPKKIFIEIICLLEYCITTLRLSVSDLVTLVFRVKDKFVKRKLRIAQI